MLRRLLRITIPKGTGFSKDVSGNMGQAWLFCHFKTAMEITVDHEWKFDLDGVNCKLCVPYVNTDYVDVEQPKEVP